MSGPELATTIAAALKILNPPRAPAAEEAERGSREKIPRPSGSPNEARRPWTAQGQP